jgi:hypothetical protein
MREDKISIPPPGRLAGGGGEPHNEGSLEREETYKASSL